MFSIFQPCSLSQILNHCQLSNIYFQNKYASQKNSTCYGRKGGSEMPFTLMGEFDKPRLTKLLVFDNIKIFLTQRYLSN
jgi:hypothetical protein